MVVRREKERVCYMRALGGLALGVRPVETS